MSTPVRIAAFVAALAVLFGAAFGAGRLFEDDASDPGPYRLQLDAGTPVAGEPVAIRFDVLDGRDEFVTDFTVRHEKPLHLIAVRKDFAEYRHLHPTMDAGGSWSVDADLPAGPWRLYADFQPAGGDLQVLTADLDVAGDFVSEEVEGAGESRRANVDDYTVEVVGSLSSGSAAELRFQVAYRGKPVTDLQPYLGAYGHLVVIRDSDLSYLHAHPGEGPAGPEIPFQVEVPAEGGYHLYLDFQHGDVVRTATFELDASQGAPAAPDHGGMDHGDH